MRTWGMRKEVRKDSLKVIKWEEREGHPDRRGSISKSGNTGKVSAFFGAVL